jgi:hypothetical protein
MDTFLVDGHNGIIERKHTQGLTLHIQAPTAADAVRYFAEYHNFKKIGRIGIRVSTIKNITHPRKIDGLFFDVANKEIKDVLETVGEYHTGVVLPNIGRASLKCRIVNREEN